MRRQFDSAGRAVLVTGTSSGIGYATAVHLARNGFTVFGTVRKREDRDRIAALGLQNLVPIEPFDLTRHDQIKAGIRTVREELDNRHITGLYGLVNNAGGGGPAPVELLPVDSLRRELDTRIVGAVAVLQSALPLLRNAGGRVIWITTPAIIPTPYVSAIHACDFAVNCLSRTLDIELGGLGIPSIMVRCGGVRTPAGLRTVSDVELLFRTSESDAAPLYEGRMRDWAQEMEAFDRRRIAPVRVARTVELALSAPRPKRRYSIGHMARIAVTLELLPQPLADAILRRRFAPGSASAPNAEKGARPESAQYAARRKPPWPED